MKYLARVGGAAGIALALSACGTLYKLDVTAYNDPNAQLGDTYVLLSGSPDLPVNSPEFERYAAQVERVLAEKGYRRVSGDALDDASLGIYIAAGISDPGKRYHQVSRGIYEPSDYTSGIAVPRSGGNNSGGSGNTGGVGGGQQTQVMPPVPEHAPQQLAGYETDAFATTIYTKHMNLIAIDLQQYLKDVAETGRARAVPKEIWSVDVETTGTPSDLGEVIPVMLVAGEPYIAASTDDVVEVRLNGTDKRIATIKGER